MKLKKMKVFFLSCILVFMCVMNISTVDAAGTDLQQLKSHVKFANNNIEFNVLSYGADGSGNTDSSNAINQAINAAAAVATKDVPALVYLPNGTYKIESRRVALLSNIYILAESNVVYDLKGSLPAYTARAEDNVGNVTIDGGTIKGNDKPTLLLNIGGANNIVIKNCNMSKSGSGYNGISIANSSNIEISDCSINTCGKNAISLDNSKNIKIERCTTSSNKKEGIYVSGGSSTVINNVTASSNSVNGIMIIEKSTAELNNCTTSKNTKHGINTLSSKLSANNCKSFSNGNMRKGEEVHGINVNASTVSVKECTLYANSRQGVNVSKGSNFVMSESNSYGNGWNGISVSGSGTTVNIKGNNFTDNGVGYDTSMKKKVNSESGCGHGIGITEYAKATIEGNTIKNNTTCGISSSFGSTSYIQSGNSITNNGRHAIGLMKAKKVVVKGNKLQNNGYNGILVSVGSTCYVYAQAAPISGNKNNGITVSDASTCTIKDVTISNNRVNGITVAGGKEYTGKKNKGSKSTIDNCDINNNRINGITISKESSATITKTQINKNKQNGVSIGKGDKKLGGSKATIDKASVISQNGKNGIYVTDLSCSATVKNTKVSKNSKYGINAVSGGSLKLTSVTVSENKNHGVFVSGKGSKLSIEKSTVNANKQNGIYVSTSATATKINNNKVTGNKKYGIGVYSATAQSIKSNKLSNSSGKKEIYLSKAKTNTKEAKSVKINKVTSKSKSVTGTAPSKISLNIKANKKSYKVTTTSKGKYSIKISECPVKSTVEVEYTVKGNNTIYNTTKVK